MIGFVFNILIPSKDEYRLEQIIKKYSQFISYPITLMMPQKYHEVDDDIDTEEDDEDIIDGEDDDEDEDEADDEEEDYIDEELSESSKSREEKIRFVPKLMNEAKAVWLRSPSAVEDEEYSTLYTALAPDSANDQLSNFQNLGMDDIDNIDFASLAKQKAYLSKVHFVGEGEEG